MTRCEARIIVENCLNPKWGITSLDKVNHVITDPPYSARTQSSHMVSRGNGAARKAIDFNSINDDERNRIANAIAAVVKRWALIFTDDRGLQGWFNALEDSGLEVVRSLVWVKRNATPQFSGDRPGSGFELIVVAHRRKIDGTPKKKSWNAGGKRGIYDHPVLMHSRVHDTQKPLGLMSELVRDFTDVGDTILDPFAGSGTTLVAAKQWARNAIGFETSTRMATIARDRIRATSEDLHARTEPVRHEQLEIDDSGDL